MSTLVKRLLGSTGPPWGYLKVAFAAGGARVDDAADIVGASAVCAWLCQRVEAARIRAADRACVSRYALRMSVPRRIMEDLKQAMRDKDEVARDALRMLKTELGRREVELGRDLDESEILELLQKAVKAREDSIQQYEQGGRDDLAKKETREIELIRRYMPQPMAEPEAREAIRELAHELGATSKKDMGRVMKAVMDRYRGRIDGKLASRLAGDVLG